MRIFCSILKRLLWVLMFIWTITTIFVFFQWKYLYYYPDYDLYLFIDGGIVGNRTIMMGPSLEEMHTTVRYDARGCFPFYIGKDDGHFYIYWPEDTVNTHYSSFRVDNPRGSFTFKLQETEYHPFLKEFKSDNPNFVLVPYMHQELDNWIESFETWTDTLHWNCPGQIKMNYDMRLSQTNVFSEAPAVVPVVKGNFFSFMGLCFRALDCKSFIFLQLIFIFVLLYVVVNVVERRL